jgi:hypothetical protein
MISKVRWEATLFRPKQEYYNLLMYKSVTKTPLGRRWSSPPMAALAAQALIKHSMNATRAARELRPHLTEQSARKTGSRMIRTPAVQAELEKLTSTRGLNEHNADRFLDELWSWLLGDDNAMKLTAARILGRLYVTERMEASPPHEPFRIEGIDEDAIRVLTGEGPEQR